MHGVRKFLGLSAISHMALLTGAFAQNQTVYSPPSPQTYMTPAPAAAPLIPVVPSPADLSARRTIAPAGPLIRTPPAAQVAPAAAPVVPAAPAVTQAEPAPAPGPDGAPVAAPAMPKPKPVAAAPKPGETALSRDPAPTFGPETYQATQDAADRYANIVLAGGWPQVAGGLRPGARGKDVSALRQRLAIEGDLESNLGLGENWDESLTVAVKRFQNRMGLRQTGIVAGATLKAINVPADLRARQLAASAQRAAAYNFTFGERYVVVNIPSAVVEAVENGRVAHRYVSVVGDVTHRSPEVTARVQAINLNPTWTVPTSIIKNEIIPKMRKDPGYLSRAKIRMLDSKGAEVDPRSINWSTNSAVNYTLRQDSGNGNSLGNIRINMPNSQSVYMHDTPSKRYFGADYRFLSHGCVRVAGVFDFAQWLLEGTGGASGAWDKAGMLAKVATKERTDIRLARPVPVIWTYMTGWVSSDGVPHFRDDVYGYDAPAVMQALADRALAVR